MHAIIVDTTLTTPPIGGAQTFLVELCKVLVDKGSRMTVVTQPGREHAIVRSLRSFGVNVLEDVWRPEHLPEERGLALAALVNTERPNAYVISISPDAGWLALPFIHDSVPTVSIAHNDIGAFYEPVDHYAPLLDCAIGVSSETTRRLANETEMPPERVRQIPYGIRSLSAAAADRRFPVMRQEREPLRIGYVGRLVEEQKRVMEFVGVALELRELGVPFELDLIGDGSHKQRLEAKFRYHQFGEEIRFWGWLSPDQVEAKLLELDAFVLLSDYEGLPVALLEAMGHGIVPVVTRIPSGNTQLIKDDYNGLLFPVGDVRTCAERLARLAAKPDLLSALRRAAWNTASNYSIEKMAERYEQCFRDLVAEDFSRAHRLTAPRPYPVLPACRSRYPAWLRRVKSRLNSRRASPSPTPSQT